MENTTIPKWVRIKTAAKLVEIKPSRFYELLKEAPAIQTCRLKSPGAKEGALLISMPSLLAYLKQLAEEQAGERVRSMTESPPNEQTRLATGLVERNYH